MLVTNNSNEVTFKISKKEKIVLNLVLEGLSSQQAADKLYITKKAIDFHLANIYKKLGVINRVQAIRKLEMLGVLDDICSDFKIAI